MDRERVTVQEAARRLGITESAIRKRVERGALEHDKEEDGRVYVYLDTRDTDRDNIQDISYDMLVTRLENENEFLRHELERKDAILLNMTEAMKALNAPTPEAPESPVSPTPGPTSTDTPTEPQEPSERPQRRRWWEFWR